MPIYNIHVLLLVYVYYNWIYYYLLNYYCSKHIYFECIIITTGICMHSYELL